MKKLLVGDFHLKVGNEAESERLIDFIIHTAILKGCTEILFMGDIYNSHGMIHLSHFFFWKKAFAKIRTSIPGIVVRSLSGNHDMDSKQEYSAIDMHDGVQPITQKFVEEVDGSTHVYLPYMKDQEAFIAAIQQYTAPVVFCHQDFISAQYENGHYSTFGVDLGDHRIPEGTTFICGHIHKSAHISAGRGVSLELVGTPRQLTTADIGEEKRLTTFEYAAPTKKSTPGICLKYIYTPEDVAETFKELDVDLAQVTDIPEVSSRTVVTLKGTREQIKDFSSRLPKGTKTRSQVIDLKPRTVVAKGQSIDSFFVQYVKELAKNKNLDANAILTKVREYCPQLKG